MRTDAGQSAFAVLLFQDIAVIPMLALLPLLAVALDGGPTAPASTTAHLARRAARLGQDRWWCSARWRWSIVAGRFLVRPVFRFIARTRLRELFTAAALLLVIGIALLMTYGRPEPGPGHLPRRRRAGQQRVPPRAGERHRAVQGAAARPVLHRGGRVDRLLAGRRATPASIVGLVAALIVVEVRRAVRAGAAVPHGPRPEPALRLRPGPGRRVRLRAVLLRHPGGRARRGRGHAAGRGRRPLHGADPAAAAAQREADPAALRHARAGRARAPTRSTRRTR